MLINKKMKKLHFLKKHFCLSFRWKNLAKREIFQNKLNDRWHHGIFGYSYVIIYWTSWWVFVCLNFAVIFKVMTTIPLVNTWNFAFAAWLGSQTRPTFSLASSWNQKVNNKSWKSLHITHLTRWRKHFCCGKHFFQ